MDTLSAFLVLCEEDRLFSVNSHHKGPVIRHFDVPVIVSLNKLLNKLSSYQWLETPWRPCDVIVMIWWILKCMKFTVCTIEYAQGFVMFWCFVVILAVSLETGVKPLAPLPTWINFNRHCNVLMKKITYPFPNLHGATVEVWEYISNFTPHLMNWRNHLSTLGLKFHHVSKRGPRPQ